MLTTGFNTARDSLADFAISGKASFKSFTNSVLADMARIASQQAASSLLSGLVGMGISAAGSYFGGGAAVSAGSTQAGYSPDVINTWAATQAKGGAWSGGVQKYAKGGAFTNSILNSPTPFGMAGGKTGLAGEAGPEAIMPLARGSDGSLGVRMVGGAGAGGTVVQISAPVALTIEDRSAEGMELDTAALEQSMQQGMRSIAERAIADSWRPGGASYRQANGRG
jgi:lambda family phage tail tape measure protein